MVSDPIGDMLAQLKNAARAGLKVIEIPHSKMRVAVAKILQEERYVTDTKIVDGRPAPKLRLTIAYNGRRPVLTDLRRVSKPGLRLYVKKSDIAPVMGGMGVAILSTPQGVMTGKEARAKGIGGELLCEVW